MDGSLRLYVGQEQHALVGRGWKKFRGGGDKDATLRQDFEYHLAVLYQSILLAYCTTLEPTTQQHLWSFILSVPPSSSRQPRIRKAQLLTGDVGDVGQYSRKLHMTIPI